MSRRAPPAVYVAPSSTTWWFVDRNGVDAIGFVMVARKHFGGYYAGRRIPGWPWFFSYFMTYREAREWATP